MPNSDILISYLTGLIKFEDVLLYEACKRENKRRAVVKYRRSFDLDHLTHEQSIQLFRFSKQEIRRLVNCLELDGNHWTRHRNKFSGTEGVCILLRRLVLKNYPCRLFDLVGLFNRSRQSLSNIFKWMINYVHQHFDYLLKTLDHDWLSGQNLEQFAKAISDSGCPLDHVWGFIDGTKRPICRPVRHQRQYYSGHKRIHCISFQSVLCPNGLIALLHGPFIGRRHDSFLLYLSKLLQQLKRSTTINVPGRTNFYLFGDTGYVNNRHLLTNFRNPQAGSPECIFNSKMSELRIAVEWGFAKIVSLFALVDFKKNNKLLLQPVGKWYSVATILTNCHTCLNGSQTTTYFGIRPPTLEDYLRKN